jgi:hypothetical protein
MAGGSTGGAAGAGMGRPPGADGKCLTGESKHTDMLCYCQGTGLTSCSDGCFDQQSDPNHCGMCTTKCSATAACSVGKCGAAPTALVPAATGCGSMHLALSGTTLYYTDETHGKVQSVPVAGGTPAVIAMTEMAPTLISSNGTTVYWLAKGAKSVKRSVAGAAAVTVVPAQTDDIGGYTLSPDGNSVYFSVKTKIFKVASDGTGAVSTVGQEDSGLPKALAIEGTTLGYPTDVNVDVDVMTLGGVAPICASEGATLINTACTRIARSQGSLFFDNFYILSGVAYWASAADVKSSPVGTPDSNVTIASAIDALSLTTFSIANSTLFFADDLGVVSKSPLVANSKPIPIARNQMGVTSIAADANNAYWATGDCAIMTVPIK